VADPGFKGIVDIVNGRGRRKKVFAVEKVILACSWPKNIKNMLKMNRERAKKKMRKISVLGINKS